MMIYDVMMMFIMISLVYLPLYEYTFSDAYFLFVC